MLLNQALYLELGTQTPIAPDDPRLRQIGFVFDYISDPNPHSIDPKMQQWRKLRWQVVYHRHTRMAKDEEGNQLFDEQGKERRETIDTHAYRVINERVLTEGEIAEALGQVVANTVVAGSGGMVSGDRQHEV